MLRHNLYVWTLLVAFLAVGAVYGKSSATTTEKSYRFEQDLLEAEIGGKVLKPGVYNIVITYENAPKGKMAVFKNKQLLVEVPCDIEKSDLKLEANSVAYGRNPDGKRYVRWLFLRDRGEKIVIAAEHP